MDGEKASVTHNDQDTYMVHTEIPINASPEIVWKVLSDYEHWKDWSPGPIQFEGEFRKDGPAKVTFLLANVGGHKMTQTFDHPLVHFEEGRMFGWSAPIPNMGITDNHQYIVEAGTDDPTNTTRFVQTDSFRGTAMHYFGCVLANGAQNTYMEFNRALKKRCEEEQVQALE